MSGRASSNPNSRRRARRSCALVVPGLGRRRQQPQGLARIALRQQADELQVGRLVLGSGIAFGISRN